MRFKGRLGSPRHWLFAICIAVLLVLAASVIFGHTILTAAGSALVEDDGLDYAQAALVLGGDEYTTRIMKAAELARAGYVPWVLVSGPEAFGTHECDLTIHYAVSRGYAADLFRPFPDSCTSTKAEADLIGKYFRDHEVTRILLVTSNYHTRRAARLFRRENPSMDVRVIPAADPWFTPNGWWRDREGRKTFLLEWTKTIAEWGG